MKLVGKVILYPVIRDQLKLRQIDRMRFETCPILNRFCDTLGKRGDKLLAIGILQDLSPVFGYDSADIDIEHLTGLKAHLPVLPGRQVTPIYFYLFNFIRVINLFQCGADMAFWAAGFFARLTFWFLFSVWIARRWFAAVCAI